MRPAIAPVLAAVAVLAAPSAAQATATVLTDSPCYLTNRTVRLTGTGFAPSTQYTVSLDGAALGPGMTSPDGAFEGKLGSGHLGHLRHQRHIVTVSDGTNMASAPFEVSRFTASFDPAAGDPRSLLVRFSVYGFGLGAMVAPTVYLHYLSPSGRAGSTVRVGRTHGACGSLGRSRLHHLFPFHPRTGTWHLQFDTHSRYSAASRPRVVRTVVVR
ncbi:MAG TPA: hypothetical protein VGN69_08285 [Solirubrobacteraceae bacterium]|nr:hypothetical protein [Solirubrobacteraceae bacterium]